MPSRRVRGHALTRKVHQFFAADGGAGKVTKEAGFDGVEHLALGLSMRADGLSPALAAGFRSKVSVSCWTMTPSH